tara:strand:+ start:104 stop:766 length:663 start_codon:yes stop_codon:yes gene_type:complete
MFDNLILKIKTFIDNNQKVNLQLLEPLSTIIRLCILYFDSEGTKIAIHNNRIYKQTPNILQGTIRWTWGNKRHELYNLYKPIIIATSKYKIENEDIKTIFEYAIKGLTKLKSTYKNTNGTIICHSIDLYIDTLQKKLTNKKIVYQNKIEFDELTNKLYEEFSKLWCKKHISLIATLLKLADTTSDLQTKQSFLNSIDLIINVKETKSFSLISEATKNIKT